MQNFISAEIGWLPYNKVALNEKNGKSVLDFIEAIEEEEDVQNVYANFEVK